MGPELVLRGQTYLPSQVPEAEIPAQEQSTSVVAYLSRTGLQGMGSYVGGEIAVGYGLRKAPKILFELGSGVSNWILNWASGNETQAPGFFQSMTNRAVGWYVVGETQSNYINPIARHVGNVIGFKIAALAADHIWEEETSSAASPPFFTSLFGRFSREAFKSTLEVAGAYFGGTIARGAGQCATPEAIYGLVNRLTGNEAQTTTWNDYILSPIKDGFANFATAETQTRMIDPIMTEVGAFIGMKVGSLAAEILLFPMERTWSYLAAEPSEEPSAPSRLDLEQVRALRINAFQRS